ncbi:DNA-packaging protein [Sphingomonas qomolangmaensis]|uniref:Terminase family protein n=1 Tax=Sphingomonas qomolangmaensis TaxID=2918765 RepID=A0ABY5LBH0_9SPHN|nr:terminase family protein [Sphingomonas qomolangmaensis]UUL84295.1 terminase family protein [Sphingomonas qomolangmaensis]
MTQAQQAEINQRWWMWAHAGQLAPPGDWRVWMIRAGRGFGKTRAGAEWVSEFARHHPHGRIALVGATFDEVVQVMITGLSGLTRVAREGETVTWRPTLRQVEFGSGALAQVFSAASPEKLRGPEHDVAWCDELGKWGAGGEAAWDNLAMGMRASEHPRILVTTTPRPTKLMRRLLAMPDLVETRGRTRDNPHLPKIFVGAMIAEYGGSRLGRQELDGELLDDVVGALWTRALIERCRVRAAPDLVRVVVGVDPPASAGGDACGIVAAGLGTDGLGYVIEDASVAGCSPQGWARAVVGCYERHRGDLVVAEANMGGDMVRDVLKAAHALLPVRLVRASKGKVARAEPVAALYESGRVFHVGGLAALEDELCGLSVGGGYEGPGRSPDRADACVWALNALMVEPRAAAAVRVV